MTRMPNPFALEMFPPEVLASLQAQASSIPTPAELGQDSPESRLEQWYYNVWRPLMEKQGIPEANHGRAASPANLPPRTPGDMFHGLSAPDLSGVDAAIAAGRAMPPGIGPHPWQPNLGPVPGGQEALAAQAARAAQQGEYATQGNAFREAFQADPGERAFREGRVPQFNVSDNASLADYVRSKQAEQAAASAGAGPEALRGMNQGVWFGSTGTKLGDPAKRQQAQKARQDVLAKRKEAARTLRLSPLLRAMETQEEQGRIERKLLREKMDQESSGIMMQAAGQALAGLGPGATEQQIQSVMEALQKMRLPGKMGAVPVPGVDNANQAPPTTYDKVRMTNIFSGVTPDTELTDDTRLNGAFEIVDIIDSLPQDELEANRDSIIRYLKQHHTRAWNALADDRKVDWRWARVVPFDKYNKVLAKLGLPPRQVDQSEKI